MNKFTFEYYQSIFQNIQENGYEFSTIRGYLQGPERERVVLNRVDVDIKINRVNSILDIFEKLNIKATFFFRLHSPNYNLLDFSNFNKGVYFLEIKINRISTPM